MNSAPHLLNEDRQEFTRLLDAALRSAAHRRYLQDLTAADSTLTTEQLRSMALSATALIAAAAAAEYQHYVKLRCELRTPPKAARVAPEPSERGQSPGRDPNAAPAPDAVRDSDPTGDRSAVWSTDAAHRPDAVPDSAAASEPDPKRGSGSGRGSGTAGSSGTVRGSGRDRVGLGGLGSGRAGPGEPAGAGLAAVIAVLAPVLAGAAALIFLLVGYVLKMVGPAPAFADTLLTTGWVFGAITAAAILVAAVGLLLTALRNSATSLRADDHAELDAALDRAREAWQQALLERGILPFLQEALVRPGTDRTRTPRPQPTGRMPHLGYHSPGFSSPESGSTTAPRPRYSSPDFSSPDFGGPEHQPE